MPNIKQEWKKKSSISKWRCFGFHVHTHKTCYIHANNKAAVAFYIRFGWWFLVLRLHGALYSLVSMLSLKKMIWKWKKLYFRRNINVCFFFSKVNNRKPHNRVYIHRRRTSSPPPPLAQAMRCQGIFFFFLSLSLHIHIFRLCVCFFFLRRFSIEMPKNSIIQFKLPLKVVRFNLQSSYITVTR